MIKANNFLGLNLLFSFALAVKERVDNKMKNRWLQFFVLYFSALAIGLNQFKVPPIMGNIAQAFQVDITSVAWLMSVFTVAGIILSIPSAKLLGKIGPKKMGIILILLLAVGSLIGAIAPNFTILLISRIIEGISFAWIMLLGMVLISCWFKPEEMGIPTGIFVTFPALAPFITYRFGAQIAANTAWNSLWYIGAGIAAIALLLFIITIKVPKMESGPQAVAGEPISFIEAFKNGKSLILGIMQGMVAFVLYNYLTLYPQIFTNFYNVDPLKANSYSSIFGLFALVMCILSGVIISKAKKTNMIIFISFIGLAISVALTFKLTPGLYIVHTLLIAIFASLIIPSVMTLAPIVAKKPSLIGYSVGIVNFFYYIGAFISPPIITNIVAANNGNWPSANLLLVGVTVCGILVSLIYFVVNKKKVYQARIDDSEIKTS